MTALVNRKQRLRTLENEIRDLAESITTNGIEIGRRLCEIRDEELWKDQYQSWNQYLKEHARTLVEKSFCQAKALISSFEVSKRLPNRLDVKPNALGPSHLREIGRLAPTVGKQDERGAEKDYSKLRKKDVERVFKKATELAGGDAPSVRDIRKAVDEDLGIARSPKVEPLEYDEDPRALHNYIRAKAGTIEGIYENLASVTDDAWKRLETKHPGLVERLATACEDLAELLRS